VKRTILLTVATLAMLFVSAPAARAFGTKDVLKMTNDGIADSLIIQKIEYSGKTFHLDADDIHALKEGGVSDEVISAMLQTEGQDSRDGYGDRAYYGPYYYPPTYDPYGHVSLGFGYYGHYGHYRSPFYGGYRYPRYRSYYRTPTSGNYGTQRYRGSYGSRPSGGSGSGARRR